MKKEEVRPAQAIAAPAPAAKEHRVSINNMLFAPAKLDVAAGDTVVWTNQDLVPHSVTAVDKSFDSGVIAPNGTWTLKAKTKGELAYSCSFHPAMKAELSVH